MYHCHTPGGSPLPQARMRSRIFALSLSPFTAGRLNNLLTIIVGFVLTLSSHSCCYFFPACL